MNVTDSQTDNLAVCNVSGLWPNISTDQADFWVWAVLNSTIVTYSDCTTEGCSLVMTQPPIHPNRGKLPPVKLSIAISSRLIGIRIINQII